MSTAKAKSTRGPETVPEAVTHLRRQLKLSMEKFAARVGCSFQTVLRWESGRAKVAEGNLVRLWELAREYAPLAEPIFARETRGYRRLLESNSNPDQKRELSREIVAEVRGQLAKIDRVLQLVSARQPKKAREQLLDIREDLQAWIDKLLAE